MADSTNSRTSITLIQLLRQSPRDLGAWDRFVRHYRPRICGWCLSRGLQEADAEDVAQEVIAILTRKIANFRYDPTQSFRAWLKVITYHAMSDLMARRSRAIGDHPAPSLETVEARDDLERRLDELFDRERLEHAMVRVRAQVAATTWKAFWMVAFEGRSGAEASQLIGIPVASVFLARHRVQKSIRKEIARLEGESGV